MRRTDTETGSTEVREGSTQQRQRHSLAVDWAAEFKDTRVRREITAADVRSASAANNIQNAYTAELLEPIPWNKFMGLISYVFAFEFTFDMCLLMEIACAGPLEFPPTNPNLSRALALSSIPPPRMFRFSAFGGLVFSIGC